MLKLPMLNAICFTQGHATPQRTESRRLSRSAWGLQTPRYQISLLTLYSRMQPTEAKSTTEVEDRLRQLSCAVEGSPAMTVITDHTGDIEYVNAKFTQVTGYNLDEVKGKNPRLLKSGLTPRTVYQEMWAAVRSGSEWQGEFVNRKKNGEVYWENVRIAPIRGSDGSILHFVAVKEDVTARHLAEESLRQSQEQFQSTFQSAAIGMALVAPEGRLLKVNQAFCDLLGYTEAELLSKSFQDITHPADLEANLGYVRQMLAGEIRTYQMEKRYFHKAGNVIWAMLSVSLVRGGEGKPLYFVSQILDMTERYLAQQERERLITELQAALAEVRTLRGIVPICMHCKKIRDDKGFWQQVESYVEKHSHAQFSHGLCVECLKTHYPDIHEVIDPRQQTDGSTGLGRRGLTRS